MLGYGFGSGRSLRECSWRRRLTICPQRTPRCAACDLLDLLQEPQQTQLRLQYLGGTSRRAAVACLAMQARTESMPALDTTLSHWVEIGCEAPSEHRDVPSPGSPDYTPGRHARHALQFDLQDRVTVVVASGFLIALPYDTMSPRAQSVHVVTAGSLLLCRTRIGCKDESLQSAN